MRILYYMNIVLQKNDCEVGIAVDTYIEVVFKLLSSFGKFVVGC